MKHTFEVSHARPHFLEPKDRAEAEQRLKLLRAEVAEVHARLRSKDVESPTTGERLTTTEYFAWRRRMGRLLDDRQREITGIRQWLAQYAGDPSSPKLTSDVLLLTRCHRTLAGLRQDGASLGEDAEGLIRQLEVRLGVGVDPVLREARECMAGNIQNTFQFGGLIARATRDDADLELLHRQWLLLEEAKPSADLFSSCATGYIETLTACDRTDIAIEVASKMPSCNNAGFSWLVIAKASEDEEHLRRAREVAEDSGLGPLWRAIYEYSGAEEDARRAADAFALAPSRTQKAQYQLLLLGKALVAHGRIEEARRLCATLSESDHLVRLQAAIVIETSSRDEYAALYRLLDVHRPSRPTSITELLEAFAVWKDWRVASSVVECWRDPLIICGAHAWLARDIDDVEEARAALARADDQLKDIKLTRTTNEGWALLEMAAAHAMHGDMPRAIELARMIADRLNRCSALLVCYEMARRGFSEILEDV